MGSSVHIPLNLFKMDNLQRLLSRQLTDLSLKRSSKRLESDVSIDDDSSCLGPSWESHYGYHYTASESEKRASFRPPVIGSTTVGHKSVGDRVDFSFISTYPPEFGHLSGMELGQLPKLESNSRLKQVRLPPSLSRLAEIINVESI